MNCYQEPNCDFSDLDVYKDWLYEFNNNDDLREIDFSSLVTQHSSYGKQYHYRVYTVNGLSIFSSGCGSRSETDAFEFPPDYGEGNTTIAFMCFGTGLVLDPDVDILFTFGCERPTATLGQGAGWINP